VYLCSWFNPSSCSLVPEYSEVKNTMFKKMIASMIQKWWWTIIPASYSPLREIDAIGTCRQSQITSRPLNTYCDDLRHLPQFVGDFCVSLVTRWAAPKVLSGALMYSPTYPRHSHGTPVPVIRDSSYSKGWPECLPRFWYSPEIHSLGLYSPSSWTLLEAQSD